MQFTPPKQLTFFISLALAVIAVVVRGDAFPVEFANGKRLAFPG